MVLVSLSFQFTLAKVLAIQYLKKKDKRFGFFWLWNVVHFMLHHGFYSTIDGVGRIYSD